MFQMRSRNIKPDFFKNDALGDLSPLARLLFIGLWCLADREGRLELRPKKIKAEILPYDSCNVEKLLEELGAASSGFISTYHVDGTDYIEIPTFSKHQSPHKNEKPSELPAFIKSHEISRLARESSDTNHPDCGLMIDDCGMRNEEVCTELPSESSEPSVVSIILNSKSLHPITQQDIDDWQELFPAVNVLQELRKMSAWADANPQRRKTDRGIRKFIVNWLSKEQDKGRKIPAVSPGEKHEPEDFSAYLEAQK